MHITILDENQQALLPFLSKFRRSFYLVGGTAIALHIGHRRSIDFDLFTPSKINKTRIKAALRELNQPQKLIGEDIDQLHLLITNVKVTFFHYPFLIEHPEKMSNGLTFPSLLTLAAMKAFALGRRSKWKDYVDLYFILKEFYTLTEISKQAHSIFSDQFSEKLFREQIAFHKDIDYSEEVEYVIPHPPTENEIKEFLIQTAINF